MKRMFLMYLMLFPLSPVAYAAVDINTASQTELESLNGIGPAKAQAIIEYRKRVVDLNLLKSWIRYQVLAKHVCGATKDISIVLKRHQRLKL